MRVNPKGIDINRDWENQAVASSRRQEEEGPPRGPQQPETRLLQSLLKEYQPTAFVSLHSGSQGVYLPSKSTGGPTQGPPSPAEKKQQKVAEKVRAAACLSAMPCQLGSIEAFFKARGNELDWVFRMLKAPRGGAPPVALALEVYTTANSQEQLLVEEGKSELGALLGANQALLAGPLPYAGDVADLLPGQTPRGGPTDEAGGPSLSLVDWQLTRAPKHRISCFLYFNPLTKEGLHTVVKQWMGGLFTLAEAL